MSEPLKKNKLETDALPECVLLVDDEPMIRSAATRILSTLGCRVLQAEDGMTALNIYRASKNDIDVVILDMGMPVMNGLECLKALKDIDPGVRVIISTGYMDNVGEKAVLSKGAAGLLPKPYNAGTLATLFKRIVV